MSIYLISILVLLFKLAKGDICPISEPDTCQMLLYNKYSASAKQLSMFSAKAKVPIGQLTTLTGYPITVEKKIESLADVNLFRDPLFLEVTSSLVQERRPERVVHAKGGGACGYFKVTQDVSDYMNVDMFNGVGKETPCCVRFSPTTPRAGGADTVRDIKGFAVKCKTQEGNLDLVALSSQVFVIKDPRYFASFAHSTNRNPQTGKEDPNMLWDFALNNPVSLYFYLKFYSDVGIPCSYTNMPGYPIHTYSFCNNKGNTYYGRFRIEPDAGVKGLTSTEAARIAGENPDYLNQDLYDKIEKKNYPSWKIYFQALDEQAVKKAPFNVFDPTLDLPEDMFPPKLIGTLYLNKNPVNYEKDIEHMGFCPSNLVPGLEIRDMLYDGRVFAYRAALDYRIGSNHNKIPTNKPLVDTYTYVRDGVEPLNANGKNAPNYFPNSFNGPVPKGKPKCPKVNMKIDIDPKPTNFKQAADFFNGLSKGEQKRTVENIVYSLSFTEEFLQKKAVEAFKKIYENLGDQIAAGLVMIKKTCSKTPNPKYAY